MSRNMSICKVDDQIYLKFRLLCAGQGVSMAKLLEILIEKAWAEDATVPSKSGKTKMKRIIKRWR